MAKPLPNPAPKTPPWTERNELSLLNAILEIANEPSETYDPRINLFDRINKNMEKSLTDREILDKIKELRNRFEKRCWTRDFRNKDVKMTKALAISEKIWGKRMEMKIESTGMTKRMKLKNAKRERKLPQAGKKEMVQCFFCRKKGHMKLQCRKYLATLKEKLEGSSASGPEKQ